MAKKPLTASERRGIIVVAVIALLIIGCGMVVSRCTRPKVEPQTEEVYRLLTDSLQQEVNSGKEKMRKDSLRRHRSDSIKKSKKKKGKTHKMPKTYRKRQPLDEQVSR